MSSTSPSTRQFHESESRALSTQAIRFFHRGEVVEVVDVHPTRSVLDWLREDARCTGTKEGCNEGDCGACTVVVGELDASAPGGLALKTVNACMQFMPTLNGKALIAVDDLKALNGGALHPAQQAMVECHGSQCGFCTPGFVMSMWHLRETRPSCPSRQEAADALAGNLCRCTGYRPILDAATRMYELPSQPFDAVPVVQALQSLASEADLQYAAFNRQQPGTARVDHFHAPRTLATLGALRERLPNARLLAGGTDVGLWVTKQFRDLGDVIWLGAVDELRVIEERHGAAEPELWIGAGASLESAWSALTERAPALREAWLRFASPPIRHAGTLGGNIANGSPIGDGAPVLMALNASVELRHGDSVRRLPLDGFYTGYQTNAMRPGEFVQALVVPLAAFQRTLRAYKISKRFDSDISAVFAACSLDLDGDTVRDLRLAFGGMAATVKRAAQAEAVLRGQPWTEVSVRAAQAALANDFQPLTDMRASAAYRLQVAQNLLLRLWLETRASDQLADAALSVWHRPADAAQGA
jgi:xanthine dehydrogenase small subunit